MPISTPSRRVQASPLLAGLTQKQVISLLKLTAELLPVAGYAISKIQLKSLAWRLGIPVGLAVLLSLKFADSAGDWLAQFTREFEEGGH